MGRMVLTEEQRRGICEYIDAGKSYREAAIAVGCNVNTAKSYALRVRHQSPKTLAWDEQRLLAIDGKHRCPKCKGIFPVDLFRKKGKYVDGYCPKCKSEYERNRMETSGTRFIRTFSACKQRAIAKGLMMNIDADYLRELWESQSGKCFYTSEKLTLRVNRRNTVSVDRIIPEKGYVRGNVVLCCDIINKMKWDMSEMEMIAWCRKVVETADKTL